MAGEFVENAEIVTTIFGKWPSFHDAEVVSMRISREGTDGPLLEAGVHVFSMTREVDDKGYFKLTHDTLVTLRFTDIQLHNLRGFNGQNVLSNLTIEPFPEGGDEENRVYNVTFGSCYGVEAELICARIVVISAEPYMPED